MITKLGYLNMCSNILAMYKPWCGFLYYCIIALLYFWILGKKVDTHFPFFSQIDEIKTLFALII